MGSNNSNFLLGLGLGALIGAMVYRGSKTPQAKKLKDAVYNKF